MPESLHYSIGRVIELEECLLVDFRARYNEYVSESFDKMLGRDAEGFWNWLLTPLHYTAAARRNFFRSALTLESAKLTRTPQLGPPLAGCGEVAWTCALIIDDIFDQASEREGVACAYLRFGTLRCVAGALAGLLIIAKTLAVSIPGSLKLRSKLAGTGLSLFMRCLLAEMRLKRVRSFSKYRTIARDVNASIHWALLGPHCGESSNPIRANLRGYADHSAIAAKMRNDLLDYSGGSTERQNHLEDLQHMEINFPILILLEAPLTRQERSQVADHLAKRQRLSREAIFSLFARYGIFEKCLALLAQEIEASEATLSRLRLDQDSQNLCELLRRINVHMLEGCRCRIEQLTI